MTDNEIISGVLRAAGLELFAPIPLSDCRVNKKYLLERAGIERGTVYVCAVPYLSRETSGEHNISAYAAVRDYHAYFAELWKRVTVELCRLFPENRFVGFTDHSPIAEAEAAVCAGLGYFGRNHLFLTNAHSSFVFLGEIITDAIIDAPAMPARTCIGCDACKRACPVGLDVSSCHSALTQKKGELTDAERTALLAQGCAWGCDICQNACSVTARARRAGTLYSSIPFFNENARAHTHRV